MSFHGQSWWAKGLALILLFGFLIFPALVEVEFSYTMTFLFQAFIFIIIAQGWNLVAGFGGQVSLGQHSFLGVGAYTTGIAWMAGWFGFLDPLAFVMSGLTAAVLAVIVGIPLLSKLRGDYFALGTLGLGEILRVIVTQGGDITGGATGLLLPSSSYTSMLPYYYLGLALAVGSLFVAWLIIRSRIGLALMCIRDDEEAASTCGIAMLKYKILIFAIGAAMAGVAGCLYAYNTFQIMPDDVFGLQWALMPLLMSIAGGLGSIFGPVLGSLVLTGIFQLTSIYLPKIHPLFSGTFIIILAIWLPDGMMSFSKRHQGRGALG